MNNEYIKSIAEKLDLTEKEIEEVVKSQFETVKECIVNRTSIRIPVLGSFHFNTKKEQAIQFNSTKSNKE